MRTLIMLLGLATAAGGQPVAIVNPGFEEPTIAAGTFATAAVPPGWSAVGDIDLLLRTIGVLNPSTTDLYPVGAPEGSNVGVVFLLDDFGNQTLFAGEPAGMRQVLVATLQTATRYTLTLQVGNIANDGDAPHNLFLFGGFPGYRVELRAGDELLAADENGLLPPEGAFLPLTLVADIGPAHVAAGQPLEIRLLNLNGAPGIEVNFDDLALLAEPSAWTDQGAALPGAGGPPRLVGHGPLAGGSDNALVLDDAAHSAIGGLFMALSSTPVPFKGGTLLPFPFFNQLFLNTSATGVIALPFVMPMGAPSGVEIWAQWAIQDASAPAGVALSNAVRGLTP
jgi:hypothetical protein